MKDRSGDLHRVEGSLTESIHKVGLDVARLQTAFGLAKWLLGLTLASSLGGIIASSYWAGSIQSDVKDLGSGMDEKFKAVDARLDKIEAALSKLVEQIRPAARP